MTKEQCLVFYPLTIRIGDDSNSYKSSILGVINNQTDKEWNKLIIELKRCFKTYEELYGIKGSNIERYKKKFVKCKVKVINQELFKKYEETYNFGGVVSSFINHDLKAIYIHIHKTGGTTMAMNLKKYYNFQTYYLRRPDHSQFCFDKKKKKYINYENRIHGIINYYKTSKFINRKMVF